MCVCVCVREREREREREQQQQRTHAGDLLAIKVGLGAVAHEACFPQPVAQCIVIVEAAGKLDHELEMTKIQRQSVSL